MGTAGLLRLRAAPGSPRDVVLFPALRDA
jgi:hypothetical protein